MSQSAFAIIFGVGPGLGAALALRAAARYPVACCARRSETVTEVVNTITSRGGRAIGLTCDVSDRESVTAAVTNAQTEFKATKCGLVVFNASAGFSKKPFMQLEERDLKGSYDVNVIGSLNVSQATLPLLSAAVIESAPAPTGNPSSDYYPPSLIFTGASASLKGSNGFASFALGKFATRAMAQSLAREYGPQGVHVAHVVVDGLIDTPSTKHIEMYGGKADGKLKPEAMAETFWHLHTQPPSAFTQELDIRPHCEKW